jgi:hypothetical protein
MTAAHQRRALEIVPDPDDTVTGPTTTDGYDWRAQTVIDQYSPEHQFVGSLMWLSADTARPLLELVPDTAIWRPQTRWAYELIRRVIDSGNDPTPPTVLAAGRRHAAADAINPDARRARTGSDTWPCTCSTPTSTSSPPRPLRATTPARSSRRPTAAGSPRPASGCSSSANAAPNLRH